MIPAPENIENPARRDFVRELAGAVSLPLLPASSLAGAATTAAADAFDQALDLLLPHVKPEIVPSLLRYGWQTAAGIYAAFGTQPAADSFDQQKQDRQNLIDRAVATNDEHGIKFADACLREYAVNPNPVYLLATRHASDRMAG